MASVYFIKAPRLGRLPVTWSLYRHGTGPGRGEGTGFLTIKAARDWAAKWGHEITEREDAKC